MLTVSDHDATSKSRKGTLRNTDSLFKDDNTETRKINLTPSLLRDDSSSSTVRSIEAKEVCARKSRYDAHLIDVSTVEESAKH